MKNSILTSSSLILTLLLSSCGGERSNEALTVSTGSIKKAITEFTDQTLIPDIRDFQQQASLLNDQSAVFCDSDMSTTTLNELQQQWYVTTQAWYRILPYNFGPANDDILDPRYRYIDYFRERGRDRTGNVRTLFSEFLSSDSEFSSDFTLAYEVGLMPLELALFENTSQSTEQADILSEYVANSRKCTILTGLTQQLLNDANYLQQGWEEDHLQTGSAFRDLFVNNELTDGSEAIDTLLVATQEFLDYVPKRDVVTAAHTIAGGGWENASSSITAISQMLKGGDNTVVSLFSLMQAAGEEVAVNSVEGALLQARLHIGQQDATSFYADSATLDGYFKREIPDSLDVSLGLNFSDGD